MKLLRNLERWHGRIVETWYCVFALTAIALALVGLVIHSIG